MTGRDDVAVDTLLIQSASSPWAIEIVNGIPCGMTVRPTVVHVILIQAAVDAPAITDDAMTVNAVHHRIATVDLLLDNGEP